MSRMHSVAIVGIVPLCYVTGSIFQNHAASAVRCVSIIHFNAGFTVEIYPLKFLAKASLG